jgi:hypothetical protein
MSARGRENRGYRFREKVSGLHAGLGRFGSPGPNFIFFFLFFFSFSVFFISS